MPHHPPLQREQSPCCPADCCLHSWWKAELSLCPVQQLHSWLSLVMIIMIIMIDIVEIRKMVSFCTSCIASNYWVVFDLVVKPVLILIGTTWNQNWSQPSIHNQWFVTYWSHLLGCLLLGKHGLVSFLTLGCFKQGHKKSVDLICQTGEQNLEQLWRERSGCRNRPGQEQRTGQHPGGRGTESPSIQMWADPRYQMYLNDDWRVTNIGDKLHSEKLRCRGVCSSRKEEAREEQQKQRCQRRHLVVCKTPAAWKNATVSKLSEIYFWTKGKL